MTAEGKSVLSNRLRRTLLATLGLIIFAFGIYLQLLSDIGLAPWNALNQGLAMHLPISYGTACNLVACCVILLDLALREPVGLGMLLDAFVVGWATDVFLALDLIPAPASMPLRLAFLLIGMVIQCVGQLIYMRAALGCGPRDAMMVALGRRFTKISVGTVNMCIFLVVLAASFALGAPIGIGTVLCVLLLGPIMDLTFHIAHFDARGVAHENLMQTAKAVAGALRKADKA